MYCYITKKEASHGDWRLGVRMRAPSMVTSSESEEGRRSQPIHNRPSFQNLQSARAKQASTVCRESLRIPSWRIFSKTIWMAGGCCRVYSSASRHSHNSLHWCWENRSCYELIMMLLLVKTESQWDKLEGAWRKYSLYPVTLDAIGWQNYHGTRPGNSTRWVIFKSWINVRAFNLTLRERKDVKSKTYLQHLHKHFNVSPTEFFVQ